jgi:hypothetical protein
MWFQECHLPLIVILYAQCHRVVSDETSLYSQPTNAPPPQLRCHLPPGATYKECSVNSSRVRVVFEPTRAIERQSFPACCHQQHHFLFLHHLTSMAALLVRIGSPGTGRSGGVANEEAVHFQLGSFPTQPAEGWDHRVDKIIRVEAGGLAQRC